jgi:uncharacterized protein (DUF1800 family)
LTVAALVLALAATAAPQPDRLAAAKAAAQKAAAEEKATHNEWNAREMARSATREIAVAARATAERALQNVVDAQEALKQKQAAGAPPAEIAAAQKKVAERLTTMWGAAERLFNDQRVANQATDDLLVIERKLAQKMQETRAAERTVLCLEAETARVAAAKAAAEKAAAETATKGKPPAEKVAAARTAEDRARATERAIREADVVTAWEAQAWLGVHRDTYNQDLSGNGGSADIATRIAAVVPEADRKKTLQEFAAKSAARKAASEKAAAKEAEAVRAADWKIYLLRVAADGGLKPLAPEAWDYAKARHLLVRAGFGGTPDEVAKLHAMGLYRAVEHLVDFHRQPAASVPFDAAPPVRPDPLEAKLRNDFVRSQAVGARHAAEGAQFGRLRHWWLERLVESPRPLQEKLTLFWHGHFATQYSVVQNSYTTYHQNQLFREHAAGNFGGLLTGLVHDPVMIRYLDNNTNVKGHANENLAREIMELFAMGVDQGYTEKDIREAARALTGYNFDHHSGQFRYIASQHDEGAKTVFGKTGNFTGDDVVNLILEQPATARFITGKLFRFFAHDNPSSETIDRLAGVLRNRNYELAPMLKNLFLSEEFYSPQTMGTQIKCPVQLVVGTLRDLGVKQVTDAASLDNAVRSMGQDLFEPPDVKGWRYGRPWVNTNRMFIRYNTIAELIRSVPQPGNKQGVDVVALLEGKGCCTAPEVVDYLARVSLVRPLTAEKRKELIDVLGSLPPPAQWASQRNQINQKLQEILILMTSIPEYQLG